MKFIKRPNLPEGKVSLISVDERISDDIAKELVYRNIEIIKIGSCKALQEPVSAHPDMLLFYGGDGDIILSPQIFDTYEKTFSTYGFNVQKGLTVLKRAYPYDIAYNAAYNGNYLICNEKYTDPQILSLCRKKQAQVINVSQGYSKCSVCFVSETAVITSDKGIYNALNRNGLDVLLISSGNIDLHGYDHGFIGGTCGKIDDNEIVFCGNIEHHPDCNRINAFLDKYNCKATSLNSSKLYDYGSLIPLCFL